ncbi:Metallo-beta-lactamase superfamily protein [Candidatus Izimaplasma bacterium HR1]|jgi:7,8-dihydropterin-6-yl-methyl-4-(beta-D-ribofuranosyl)aminobenzene 5'-phosphate synthase|uniref:MBL fold metallo-hydrolase n=1 Tax=Candidatus Izimoplasma sp. HR1 TaxID=1541959 RepID=UPI0004F73394|nr:Metallo-beta-lactamase superfamily protein [Candidatus Izimaplasma bacterium HR1]
MKVVTLLDNKNDNNTLSSAHGLSLYIETGNKKILFDLGPNNYYQKNAKKLGVDLSEVDYLVISHGHYDHGTGIKKFLKMNKKAQVFISKRAFEDHVKSEGRQYEDIGLGKAPKNDRINYIYRETFSITPNIRICDLVDYQKPPIGDRNLMIYEDGQYIEDHFHHEIYLIVTEGENNILFSGCSHKGIGNIVESVENNSKKFVSHIIGGLHFSHYDSFNLQQTDYLQKIGDKFANEKDINVYACHCTGDDAFFELKQAMRSKLRRLKTGSTIEI